MSQANQIMTKSLITISPDMSARDAIRTLLKNKISGVPVVDSDGQLVGIISEFKLLNVVLDEMTTHQPVSELMTTDVITVDEETPLCDVAQAFISLKIRRLPVLKNGKLVGQISRRDVLRCVVNEEGGDNQVSHRDELVHPAVSTVN